MNASPLFQLVFLVVVCGLMLIAAGLPGVYVRQARNIGTGGLIGFVLTVFGVLLDLGLALFAAIVVPWIATAAPKLRLPYARSPSAEAPVVTATEGG